MAPASRACTLATIAGLLCIGAARIAILPPSFIRPEPNIFASRGPIRFTVRVVPHPDLRTLRAEAWDLAPAPWSPIFPGADDGPRGVDSPLRYEPIGPTPVRATNIPLEYRPMRERESYQAWRDRTLPVTIHSIAWIDGTLAPGPYDLTIRVISNRGVSVKATRRIQVM